MHAFFTVNGFFPCRPITGIDSSNKCIPVLNGVDSSIHISSIFFESYSRRVNLSTNGLKWSVCIAFYYLILIILVYYGKGKTILIQNCRNCYKHGFPSRKYSALLLY